jgi:antitoxin MazE
MKTRVQKWGNSLALRIPKSFADEVGFKQETPVEVTLDNGKLVISPAIILKPTIDELVARITEKNLQPEFFTGPAVGKEIW